MSYSSSGSKPYERASKSSHHHVINDVSVLAALKDLHIPPKSDTGDIANNIIDFEPAFSPIQHVVAIDGGYTEVPIRDGFPSAAIHFFQFGALHFKIEDLMKLEHSRHVAPEDMQKLKNIDRLKLPLATMGARRKDCASLAESVRKTIYEFFANETLGEDISLLDTLAWFIFRRYKIERLPKDQFWEVSSSPFNVPGTVLFQEANMSRSYTFQCPHTGELLYLTDVFRLHERIEEETGAAGVAGYIAGVVEHLVLIHVIRNLLKKNAAALQQVLFIMDRPTGWFGVTAPMHKLMLELNNWLFDNHNFFAAGLEKSGAFVEHAALIREKISPGSILILNDEYIYKYISPGEENTLRPYAETSYYGHKVIFRSRHGQMYVVSLPVRELKKRPTKIDIPNLNLVLTHIEQLHCDMYENALLPIALANKLVSLSAHPSSQILRSFAQSTVK
ncbi:DNA double-strand break repair nuclease NurA [Burkholderia contaminans]|uniref:DNA double-strand break repair nuclease NurA n=1 Tax=Burkholderia contaminans TaxID=488447 RepID=UPI000F58457F|nr:DNA double-strand break repair nuclease NurA [Burkholderia contaminans]RQT24079.1 NurA domain-containing protein [Burkholderia contaminans]